MKNSSFISRRNFIQKSSLSVVGLSIVKLGGGTINLHQTFNKDKTDGLITVKEGLINQSDIKSLGLPSINLKHELIYDVRDQIFKYSHIPQLIVYRNELLLMWSNGYINEDWNGQRVVYVRKKGNLDWSTPEVLAHDPDGEEGDRFAVASGFFHGKRRLIAYFSSTIHDKSVSDLYAKISKNGKKWGEPQKIINDFHVIESPTRLQCGRIIIAGMYADRRPRILYSDSGDGLTGWHDAKIPPLPNDLKRAFPEPGLFIRPDGSIVLLLRATLADPWLYYSISYDRGVTWSTPERSGIPNATSRMSVGNLPDGRVYCIWNPSQNTDLEHKGRSPLVLAVSSDYKIFDKAYIIHDEAVEVLYEGISKRAGWQYPNAIIWENALWVAYSVNKENIMVSRIELAKLK